MGHKYYLVSVLSYWAGCSQSSTIPEMVLVKDAWPLKWIATTKRFDATISRGLVNFWEITEDEFLHAYPERMVEDALKEWREGQSSGDGMRK